MSGVNAPQNHLDHELISEALEVEALDVSLFRSKTLYLPARARGVFGGQVISQALVSATNCVDPVYSLHVRPTFSILHVHKTHDSSLTQPSLCT